MLISDALTMIREIRARGGMIRVWGGLLNVPQVLGGLLFVATIEGLAILVVAVATLVVAGQIHKRSRFSRLTGLSHLPWLALLPWLIWRMVSADHAAVQLGWMVYVAAVIAVSLVFDFLDVFRYFRGDRKFAWAR